MDQLNIHSLHLRAALITLSFTLLCLISNAQLDNRNVLSNAIKIKLPSEFKLMVADMLSTKYPPNNKPSEVYTNEAATVNIAFRKTEKSLAEQNVFAEGKKLEKQLSSSGKIELVRSEQIKENGNNIYVFTFYSNAIDTKVYNVMFIFSLKGKMVAGSVNCPIALQSQWQVTAYEIIRSIKEI